MASTADLTSPWPVMTTTSAPGVLCLALRSRARPSMSSMRRSVRMTSKSSSSILRAPAAPLVAMTQSKPTRWRLSATASAWNGSSSIMSTRISPFMLRSLQNSATSAWNDHQEKDRQKGAKLKGRLRDRPANSWGQGRFFSSAQSLCTGVVAIALPLRWRSLILRWEGLVWSENPEVAAMFESFEQYLWLLLLIPGFYLGVPLLIRAQQKMHAHPRMEPLDFDRLRPSISQFIMKQTKV